MTERASAPEPGSPSETKPTTSTTLKKWRRRAVLLGVALALVCKLLPSDYRGLCEAVASVCTGGF